MNSTTTAATPGIDTAATPAAGYRWVILGVLWIAYIGAYLSRLSVGPLGPFFKNDLRLTSVQVGFVLSASALGYVLSLLPVGWLVDRIGARWLLAIGEFIAGGSMIALFYVGTYPALLSLIFITGAACGFLTPATTQAVVVWFRMNERATVMGFKQTAVPVGGMIGAATLPAVAVAFGWRYGFLFLGVIVVAIGIGSAAFYREPRVPITREHQPPAAKAVPVLEILRNRQIWLVSLCGGLLNWIEMATISHFVLYLVNSLHFAVIAAGGLLALAEGVGAIGAPISGFMSDRLFTGRRAPVFILFAATAASMCLLLGLAGPHLGRLLYPVVLVLGVGAIGFGGIYLTLLSEFGGRGGSAKAAGFGSTIAAGGSILGPPTFGRIVDVTGSYDLAWISLAAVGALAVILLSFVREGERKI
jgi:sugar phosphate permease